MSTWGRRGLSRAVRARVLERDGHTCQLQYDGCLGIATEIDDVIPVSQLGDVTREDLTDDNRQAVCSHCHHVKTETHRIAAVKAAAARRYARRHLPVEPHPGEMR